MYIIVTDQYKTTSVPDALEYFKSIINTIKKKGCPCFLCQDDKGYYIAREVQKKDVFKFREKDSSAITENLTNLVVEV